MGAIDDRVQPDETGKGHHAPSFSGEEGSLVERWFLCIAVIGILTLCGIVTVTVISRTVYKPLIPDDVLLIREVMVAVILLPLGVVTASRAHISISVFTAWAGPRLLSLFSAIGHGIGIIFAALMAFAGYRMLTSAWASGEYFDGQIYLPLWIGYATFVFALAAFLVRLALMLVQDIHAIIAHR